MADKELTQKNFEAMRDHLWNRIHRTGEEMKNDFPNLLRRAVETEAWSHFTNAEGKPYPGLVEWLHGGWPGGCMMGTGKDVLTIEEALKLTEGHPEVHRALTDNASKARVGKPKGPVALILKQLNHRCGRSAVVLGMRLREEHPDFYEKWERGEFKTLRAAAIAAGLVKSANVPLPRLKYFWSKAGKKDREAFRKWMDSKEAK
jgi:hypothetical protein